ncbi:MAG: hydantoinase/oxoprolinase family protein [Nitrososphaerota archaeon]
MLNLMILALDGGGVNSKAAAVKSGNVHRLIATYTHHFPIWKFGKERLPEALNQVNKTIGAEYDAVALTMTAELSDAYRTKREGVNHILDCVAVAFPDTPIQVLNVEARLVSVEEARRNPLAVASANWAATGWLVSRLFNDCIAVDTGSTTTSIIPVVDGKNAAEGKTDMEKLANGELVYTGALRTNVATIVSHIPLRGSVLRVSSELFAQSGDVHLILGNISEKEYTVDTADGRGRTRLEAMARLARVVCADTEMLSQDEIMEMARYIYERQVEQIAQALTQVYARVKRHVAGSIPIVVTGIGGKFLARKAAEWTGIKDIVELADELGSEAAAVTPSVGVAFMAAEGLEGGIRWRP